MRDIQEKILSFFPNEDVHERFRSWEYCYGFFQQHKQNIITNRELAALQLGFYLASWGMYRGSSFLLQHAYTIHFPVIDCLGKPCFSSLWESEFGSEESHNNLIPSILAVIEDVCKAYEPFWPSDILATKIILGTIGCLPACDINFTCGFKKKGFKYKRTRGQPSEHFIKTVYYFCRQNLDDLREVQEIIRTRYGKSYPLMKLVDMYFFRIGELERQEDIDAEREV